MSLDNVPVADSTISITLEDCVEILDNLRKPVNNSERLARIENKKADELYPYYGATGQVGWIDDYLFDGEFIALGEDGVPFLDPFKNKAYMLHGKTWVNNHAHVLSAIKGLSINKYLFHFLNHFDYLGYVNGGTRLKLTQANMRKIPIKLPSLNEQQEIVRQLDVMLAQVEQIKARLDAIPAILKKFRQSVLADAVSGKLTEEWRKSNPHTISIETIESCRLNKWWLEKQKDLLSKGKKVTEKDKAKYKPAYLPESNFYGAIPPEWSLCTIDHLFDVTKLAGFEFTKFVKYHDDYDIPVIKAENVGKNGFKETQFSKVEKTVVDALPRSSIFGNELLIVFVGAGTGQVGRVPSNRRYFLGPNVALVKPNLCDLINSEFFEYLLRSLSGQDSLLSFAKGAAQPSLSMDQIRHATIVVPPIEEQEVILASIKILFNKASQIESLVNIAQKRVNLLTQSILAKAFSGELTAEWREQHQELITGINSAESLLAKIQKEREASKPVKKAKKVK